MGISERVELLSTYTDIPHVLTLSAMSTELELELVSNEDYNATMLDIIFPKLVQGDINFRHLLEIDYQWLCRCLRILSYGSEVTIRSIICDECGSTSQGEYKIDIRLVECKPLPQGFVNNFIIQPESFLDESIGYVSFHLPTVDEYTKITDSLREFDSNPMFSRICHVIDSIGNVRFDSPEAVKLFIQDNISAADYQVLCSTVMRMSDYGLKSYGDIVCPKCKKPGAKFLALADDIYFIRPWELNSQEDTINVDGQMKTYQQVRQKLYESIVDETLFIARASEGAVSAEWIMSQPVFIRKKYVDSFNKELKDREAKLNKNNTNTRR